MFVNFWPKTLDSTYLPIYIFLISGLSVDMAVFRDLMKLRLPGLSKHLDDLQNDANEGCNRKFLFIIQIFAFLSAS